MPANRPHGRKRNDSGHSVHVSKRGNGLKGHGGRSSVTRGTSLGGGIVLLIALLLFGTNGFSSLFSSSSSQSYTNANNGSTSYYGTNITNNVSYEDTSSSSLNTNVSSEARDKFTVLKGDGTDTATVLVYMCGADLESQYGMATADINEMAYATQSDQVNVILQTGGAKKWKNSVISNATCQRYKVTEKALQRLDDNVGNLSMTEPSTLQDFINWGVQAYPADRYELIFWDHGGGSISGYGYDEKFPNGSMSVDEIYDALKGTDTKFDFIGFDACLMANTETAIALSPYADYMIASEETEPGTGWYYTTWLSAFAKDPSISTTELGKSIIDSYITADTSNSKLTLSLVDLAEFSETIPSRLTAFSKDISETIKSDDYQTVADARSVTREFSQSSKLDQIDLVDFCNHLDTDSAKDLSAALESAVKYRRNANITNAYGLSIYFPYANTKLVSSASDIYEKIGFNDDYTDAIRSFATLSASGQIAVSHSSSSIFDILNGSSVSNGTSFSSSSLFDYLSGMSSSQTDLSDLLGGGSSVIDSSSLDLFSSLIGRDMVSSDALKYSEVNGNTVLSLSEEDWSRIHSIALNVWVDDGGGYIDLGYDNIFEFDEEGNLLIDYDGKWLTINDHVVSYTVYEDEYTDDDNWHTYGYIPAYLNQEEVKIMICFDQDHPDGVILGAQKVYDIDVEGKGLIEIQSGDQIDFTCSYYDYDGNYQDTYYLGDTLYVEDELVLQDASLTNEKMLYAYQLTDIYNAKRMTPVVNY